MTTLAELSSHFSEIVVEAYRLDRYDNFSEVEEALHFVVVEAYRLDRYDNFETALFGAVVGSCRSLSFG